MMSKSLATGAAMLNARGRTNKERRYPRQAVPTLVMMTDLQRYPDPVAAARRLPRGAAVILRDRGHPARLAVGLALAAVARRRGLVLLVAGDADLAQHLRAQGLHLPEAEVHRAPGLRQRHRHWLLTGAAHGWRALNRAAAFGLDGVLLSPVFATASHPGGDFLGPLRFQALARGVRLPVLALGGVEAASVGRLPAAAAGLAAIGGLAEVGRPSLLSRRWRGSPLSGGRAD